MHQTKRVNRACHLGRISPMKTTLSLLAATALAFCWGASTTYAADHMTVGFSQIGSESGWRAAETTVTTREAEKRHITLKFSDAHQKQEARTSVVQGQRVSVRVDLGGRRNMKITKRDVLGHTD